MGGKGKGAGGKGAKGKDKGAKGKNTFAPREVRPAKSRVAVVLPIIYIHAYYKEEAEE